MTRSYRRSFMALALVAAGALAVMPVRADRPQGQGQMPHGQQHQQMTQQQMLQHVQEQSRRMDQIALRAQDMSRQMAQQMSQARDQQRDHLRLLQQYCDAMGAQARETKRTMDQLHQMLRNETMLRDPDMQQDMDRLRLHSTAVADGMQEMVGAIERIHARLRVR